MKKFFAITLLLSAIFLGSLAAAMTTSSSSSTPSYTPKSPTPAPTPPPSKPPSIPLKKPPIKKPAPTFTREELERLKNSKPFTIPGIIGQRGGRWVGVDYLGHLSDHINIYVEIVQTEKHTDVLYSQATLTSLVAKLFSEEGIIPSVEITNGPPLPLFHILVMVYNFDQTRYAIFCSGRLFEAVKVERKDTNPLGTWQAITWEKQELGVSTEGDLARTVIGNVEEITKSFLNRYNAYNLDEQTKQHRHFEEHPAHEEGQVQPPAQPQQPSIPSQRQSAPSPSSGGQQPH